MVNKPTQSQSLTHHPTPLSVQTAHPLVPAIVLNHVGQLDDELALFIFLTALEGVFLQGAQDRRMAGKIIFHRIKKKKK